MYTLESVLFTNHHTTVETVALLPIVNKHTSIPVILVQFNFITGIILVF